ncbi:hypothetical protein P608_26060 [Comamonas thiooxydans]|uniref:Uncharacterized protein n=1 Tax=Comamonas thiooxydans TaxID=363952 RepID=A0A0E3BPH7_9BURK|nr:hypothetical protein P608_26060 [Comamonas thiooxydans]KGH16588.1 hypothetical protein P607_19135 [Comamonas thiooxydans]KGH17851.1 hypothetical protein P606_25380 [Comamonas thiooxydans]
MFKRCDNVRLTAMTHAGRGGFVLEPLKPLPAMGRMVRVARGISKLS